MAWMMAADSDLFKGRHFDQQVIVLCVRWYLSYKLSSRDLVNMMEERGIVLAHTTILRWVQRYVPEFEKRWARYARSVGGSWRCDETYIKVKGRWTYLYRAVDKQGRTVDFLLSERRDVAAAKRFFRKAMKSHPTPRVITLDAYAASHRAIGELKSAGAMPQRVRIRSNKYLNNVVEQDHRRIKHRIRPMLGFKQFEMAASSSHPSAALRQSLHQSPFGLRRPASHHEHLTLKRLCSVGWGLAGVLAIAYYGAKRIQPDLVFGSLVRDLLPSGFVGLMLACVMASVMDVGSVLVLSTSALFTQNLLRRFRRGEQQGREILIGRVFSLVYVAASVALALSFPDVPSAIRFMWGLLPMIGIAFWLGLWWRRANRYGAIASFVAAAAAWFIGLNLFRWTGDKGLPALMTFYMVSGFGAGILVSVLTKPEPRTRLDRFYLTINTPIGQEDKIRQFEEASMASAQETSVPRTRKQILWFPKLIN